MDANILTEEMVAELQRMAQDDRERAQHALAMRIMQQRRAERREHEERSIWQ